MISLTHLLLIGVVVLLIFGPTSVPRLGRVLGEGAREFKKGLRGERDIDVTYSVPSSEENHSREI